MDRRRIGYVVVAMGVVIVIVSALADQLGIGGDNGFGWKQVIGVIVGAVIVVVGVWLSNMRDSAEPVSES